MEKGSASTNVVMSLMDNLLDSGRILYTDNYYTSVTLASKLLRRQTHLVGTLRSNRKYNSKNVVSKKLKKNEVFAEESGTGIVMLKWKDKRDVLMLSTIHDAETVNIKNKNGKDSEKPKAVVDYNNSKAYIDLSDQLKAYSHCLRRGLKWYRKLALELIFGSTLVNAFILYKEITQNRISITKFKELLALRLIRYNEGNNLSSDEEENEHVLIDHKKGRCVGCYANMKIEVGRTEAKKKCKRSKYQCSVCLKT